LRGQLRRARARAGVAAFAGARRGAWRWRRRCCLRARRVTLAAPLVHWQTPQRPAQRSHRVWKHSVRKLHVGRQVGARRPGVALMVGGGQRNGRASRIIGPGWPAGTGARVPQAGRSWTAEGWVLKIHYDTERLVRGRCAAVLAGAGALVNGCASAAMVGAQGSWSAQMQQRHACRQA
jgi:hypothetical protein